MERNYSIDLIRIIAMIAIVIVHLDGLHAEKYLHTFDLYAIGHYYLDGVNLFGFISGYCLIYKKFKTSRLLEIYLHVCFYMVLFFAVFHFLINRSINRITWPCCFRSPAKHIGIFQLTVEFC